MRPPPRPGKRLLLIALAGVVFGLVGTTLGVVGLASRSDIASSPVTSSSLPTPTISAEEKSAAKARICDKFREVSSAVDKNTRIEGTPGSPDKELYDYTASVQARLTLVAASQALTSHIEPATPSELAEYVRVLADVYLDEATATLSGTASDDSLWQSLLAKEAAAKDGVDRQCK